MDALMNQIDEEIAKLTAKKKELVSAAKGDVRIVIGQRGWVWVGRYTATTDEVVLTDAAVIRIWGTSKGIGELVSGPVAGKTMLDKCGTVRLHPLAVIASVECDSAKWSL